jgi:hypothetical protein
MSSEKTKQLYDLPKPMLTSIHKMKFIFQKIKKQDTICNGVL